LGIARIDALATLLDTALIVPILNLRFGLDAVLGLVPGIGDLLTTAMSLYIVHQGRKAAGCASCRLDGPESGTTSPRLHGRGLWWRRRHTANA
jgi:hypothetical protein